MKIIVIIIIMMMMMIIIIIIMIITIISFIIECVKTMLQMVIQFFAGYARRQ